MEFPVDGRAVGIDGVERQASAQLLRPGCRLGANVSQPDSMASKAGGKLSTRSPVERDVRAEPCLKGRRSGSPLAR